MTRISCPICRSRFDSNHTEAFPFCSPRCQQVDLGRWLNEEYFVPVESEEEEEPPWISEDSIN
ncbi:MAG: DNA gyrase inhibitor YacG [Pirellulaceae bacterium]|jgi:hypothetical protein|nr:DNA gyrase inhibitor YacG [Pirellulaceae bacterium]